MNVADRAVLITGASRGLGRALAFALAEKGARLVLVARDGKKLGRVVEELRARGLVAHGISADIGDKHAIHAIVGRAQALVGPIDVLVHNASTLGPVPLALLADTECEELEQTLQVNLVGAFRLSKALVPAMALRKRGLVVHISSDAAVEAYPRWGAYGVSKAALDHLARHWAAELEGTGVRVLSIDPGEMDTDMHREAIPDADPATLASPDDVAARIVRWIEREGPSPLRVRAADEEVSS
jgi:NAD(P)-dependent dehydrogenase (short-subunit alcohol dehydrogenase family)